MWHIIFSMYFYSVGFAGSAASLGGDLLKPPSHLNCVVVAENLLPPGGDMNRCVHMSNSYGSSEREEVE